jgi:ribosomal protein L31
MHPQADTKTIFCSECNEEFKSNSCFFPFDLSPDLCNSLYLHGWEEGSVDIDIGFKTPCTENLYCLMYASYDEVIEIDKNRSVSIKQI